LNCGNQFFNLRLLIGDFLDKFYFLGVDPSFPRHNETHRFKTSIPKPRMMLGSPEVEGCTSRQLDVLRWLRMKFGETFRELARNLETARVI
jgi:hypothetical protein